MAERDDERYQRGGHASGGEIDPDAPPTAEEIAAAERLRDVLDDPSGVSGDEDVDLVRSLKAAWSPEPLDPRDHAAILDELPTAEELALADELRQSLETAGREPEIVGALRAAWRPAPIDEAEHRAIVERAIGGAPSSKVVPLATRQRRRAVRLVVVTTTSVLALAASVVVWLTPAQPAEAPLAKARSTQPLFDAPFKTGEASARIDRIVMARAADYRDNRFAKWGVR